MILAITLTCLLLASTARADVSDSGNLTIGGQGVIAGSMTVQGSAFSVGGATFSVAGGSVTLGGRLNAAAAGIKWADGTTSTTAASGGGGSLTAVSSRTYIPNFSWAGGGSIGPCAAGSTITLTLSGNRPVALAYTGSTYNTNGSDSFSLGILRNGAFFANQGPTAGGFEHNTAKAAPYYYDNASFLIIDSSPGTGSTNYCLTYYTTGNTGNLYNPLGGTFFSAWEIH